MLLTMGVSLYTSRVVLNTLGVEDFGIYNVVGGVVVLFSFINGAMSTATQRFLSFELGRNDIEETKRVFSMSMTVHFSIVFFVILLAETIGLWFLNTQMNIATDRMNAANWVYQFSILTTCVGIMQVPYNASIIAHEKMSFYAYIGIVEVVFKLLVAGLVIYISFDKLKIYSGLIFLVAICIFFIYKFFCNKKLEICNYHFFLDSSLYKKLMSFSGWSLFGSVATMSSNQGVNILLNIFYGVTVNASMGIANQVNGAINSFVNNFQTAFRPQIVKSYAAQEQKSLEQLIYRTSKMSFLLLFALTFPVMINIDFVLKIWLKTVPNYAATFCNIIQICALVEAISAPLWMTVQATGKIKKYQLWISSALGLNIILSYIFLKMGYSPEIVLKIKLFVYALCLIIRMIFMQSFGIFRINSFAKNVLWRVLWIVVITIPIPFLIHKYYTAWAGLILTSLSFFLFMLFSVYFIGFTNSERKTIKYLVMNKIKGVKNG
jgi:O-antigen/teichoic acid export membrane protein